MALMILTRSCVKYAFSPKSHQLAGVIWLGLLHPEWTGKAPVLDSSKDRTSMGSHTQDRLPTVYLGNFSHFMNANKEDNLWLEMILAPPKKEPGVSGYSQKDAGTMKV